MGRGYGGGGRGRVSTYRYTVTTGNDSCIKMGSNESRFNVSLIVRDKVTRQCPQTTTFFNRKESRSGIEPRSFCLPTQRLTVRPNRLRERDRQTDRQSTRTHKHTLPTFCAKWEGTPRGLTAKLLSLRVSFPRVEVDLN